MTAAYDYDYDSYKEYWKNRNFCWSRNFDDDWTKDEQRYFAEVVLNSRFLDSNDIEEYFRKQDGFCEAELEEDLESSSLSYFQEEELSQRKELTFLFSSERLKGLFNLMLFQHQNNIFNSFIRRSNSDLFFTPNTFKVGSKTPKQENLFNVYCLALDVDYKDHGSGNGSAKPEDFFWAEIAPLCGSIIPVPSYIEVGHQLRLIFVLSEPILVQGSAKGKRLLKAAKQALKRLSEALNSELSCGCEPQKVSSYYRFPGSVNSKDGSTVRVRAISEERYSLQEIMDEFLPPVPDWYTSWVTKRKGKKQPAQMHNSFILWKNRLEKLEEIRSEKVNRENLCFVYAQGILWTNPDVGYDELMEKVYEFNMGFPTPLKEKELRSKMNSMKVSNPHRFKNSTINEFIGLEAFSSGEREREKERKERIAKGEMRWQKTEAKAERVKELKAEGKTNKDIAEIMGVSVRQIQKLNKK